MKGLMRAALALVFAPVLCVLFASAHAAGLSILRRERRPLGRNCGLSAGLETFLGALPAPPAAGPDAELDGELFDRRSP